jgi:DedD protein
VLPDDAAIAAARTQARRRLVGAVLLLGVGVIGFPLLFETQPRPLPPDMPIVLSAEAQAQRAAGAAPATTPRLAPVLPVLPADAGNEPVVSASAPTPAVLPAAEAQASAPGARPSSAVATAAAASRPKPATAPTAPATRPASLPTPATATAPTPAAGRWVVQVGAYNDVERLKAARAKLQKLGYASYTQEVDSSTGRRTRVRVGPYKTRAEADAVAARVKTTGLQAAVLSL